MSLKADSDNHKTPGTSKAVNAAGRGCMVLFGLPFLAAGIAAFSFGVWQGYMNLFALKAWQEVEATIVSTKVEAHNSSDGTTYKPVIKYRYKVGPRRYTSSRYRLTGMSTANRAAQERITDEFEVGRTCTAYYDPGDPSQAVLNRDISYMFVVLVMFGLVFAGVGGGIVFGPFLAGRIKKARQVQRDTGKGIKPEFDKQIVGPWVFALFWNGVTFTVYGGFTLAPEDLPWFLYLFFTPFFFIGAMTLGQAIRLTRERRKFSGLRLRLFSAPVAPGETAGWEMSDPRGRLAEARTVRAYVVYRTQKLGRTAGRPHTDYKREINDINRFRGASSALSGVLSIPDEPREIRDDADKRCGWWLRLTIGRRRCHFPLPVEVPAA
ncbi:MAG: DUF3592 domain-containing protein [Planctomycetes bacterium]|nr:DUF3592 domain-containing protein [Planctomycetota bacterium]